MKNKTVNTLAITGIVLLLIGTILFFISGPVYSNYIKDWTDGNIIGAFIAVVGFIVFMIYVINQMISE